MLTVIAGDTTWMLTCAALLFLMTPGLAFFYGGQVRAKNILSILMQSLMVVCLVTLQWVLFGYSLSFGPDHNGWIGTLAWVGLQGVGAEPNIEYCSTIPHQAFMIYQLMFAIFTPALLLGAFAERMKFGAFCFFTLLWTTLVYDPVAHWIWGVGGFLRSAGGLDFAGGAVVHANAGMAALAAAMVLGKREGAVTPETQPHNLPLAVLGAGMVWFGGFGRSGGSAPGAGALAANTFIMIQVAAVTAGLTWTAIDWILHKHASILGMVTGVMAGLAAISPAAGFVDLGGAIAIGVGGAGLCYSVVSVLKTRLAWDDSLNVFGIHGMGGIWGILATGLWASKTINPSAEEGLFYGNAHQMLIQMKTMLATCIYSFAMSYAILKGVDLLIGLRVSEQSEEAGLDLSQHRESGYH